MTLLSSRRCEFAIQIISEPDEKEEKGKGKKKKKKKKKKKQKKTTDPRARYLSFSSSSSSLSLSLSLLPPPLFPPSTEHRASPVVHVRKAIARMSIRGKIGHGSFARQVPRWMANTQQWLFDLNSLTTGEADVTESLTVTGDRLYSATTSTTAEASWDRRWPYREFDSRRPRFLLLFSLSLALSLSLVRPRLPLRPVFPSIVPLFDYFWQCNLYSRLALDSFGSGRSASRDSTRVSARNKW